MIFVNPDARVNRNIPNIGLAYAATHFNAKVIDLNTRPERADRFLDYNDEVLGISVQSRTFSEAKNIAEKYKEKNPDTKVKSVSGFLDIQCCYPYLDFEDKISYDKPFSDEYPFPKYELFDSFEIFKKNWKKGKWNYAIMTSQGCPYQCIYCASRNRKFLARSAQNCYEELKLAKEKYGIKSFLILDDCFNVDEQRVIDFCNLIKPLKLKWACANGLRADRFNEEMARTLSESGCISINFGIESINDEVLREIKKGENSEHINKAIDIAKRYASNVSGFFIIGLPGSSYEKDLESLNWAKDKGINAHFSYYVPFDKGEYYDEIFWGENAKPLSDTYPKELQEKLYDLTSHMRGSSKNIFRKIFNYLKT